MTFGRLAIGQSVGYRDALQSVQLFIVCEFAMGGDSFDVATPVRSLQAIAGWALPRRFRPDAARPEVCYPTFRQVGPSLYRVIERFYHTCIVTEPVARSSGLVRQAFCLLDSRTNSGRLSRVEGWVSKLVDLAGSALRVVVILGMWPPAKVVWVG
jgi:hypothetical protein